jgi:hypothetical protein
MSHCGLNEQTWLRMYLLLTEEKMHAIEERVWERDEQCRLYWEVQIVRLTEALAQWCQTGGTLGYCDKKTWTVPLKR